MAFLNELVYPTKFQLKVDLCMLALCESEKSVT